MLPRVGEDEDFCRLFEVDVDAPGELSLDEIQATVDIVPIKAELVNLILRSNVMVLDVTIIRSYHKRLFQRFRIFLSKNKHRSINCFCVGHKPLFQFAFVVVSVKAVEQIFLLIAPVIWQIHLRLIIFLIQRSLAKDTFGICNRLFVPGRGDTENYGSLLAANHTCEFIVAKNDQVLLDDQVCFVNDHHLVVMHVLKRAIAGQINMRFGSMFSKEGFHVLIVLFPELVTGGKDSDFLVQTLFKKIACDHEINVGLALASLDHAENPHIVIFQDGLLNTSSVYLIGGEEHLVQLHREFIISRLKSLSY